MKNVEAKFKRFSKSGNHAMVQVPDANNPFESKPIFAWIGASTIPTETVKDEILEIPAGYRAITSTEVDEETGEEVVTCYEGTDNPILSLTWY